jgi:hypothetical protein
MKLEAVKLESDQTIELPHHREGHHRSDPALEAQLRGMFARLRAALSAWMQAVDHLVPRERLGS